ncbi:MAG: pallilysin-related adhesin, partial [Spirochaetaceae bacterium]
MMRPFLFFLSISGVLFLLLSCSGEEQVQSSYVHEPREIELTGSGEQVDTSNIVDRSEYSSDEELVPRVQVPPDMQIIQLLEVNLDLDRNDEQIISVKGTKEGDDYIRLMVAAYDSVRDKYTVSWEGRTKANSRRSYSVSVLDVTGDHNLEIICNGMTSDGHQTLDIFRRTGKPEELGLHYEPILSLDVKGTIELQEEKRSQSYQKGLSRGDAFPVVTTTEDDESDRLGDLIKSTYRWRSGSGEYERVKRDKIAGDEIEDQQLRELLEGDREDLERFLDGPWLLTGGGDKIPTDDRYVIHFDSYEESVTLYSGRVQESYNWNDSHRFLSDSLSINGENTIIPFMRIYLSVEIRDLSTIRLTVADVNSHNGTRSTNDTWSGTYQNMGDSMQDNFLRTSGSDDSIEGMPKLSGVYKNDGGDSFYFDSPNFRLEDGDKTVSGGFSTYSMGTDILELRVVDEKGIVEERRTYSFDFTEEQRENEILRRLVLRPGKIVRSGFTSSGENPLIFHQREVIEDESEDQGDGDNGD